MCWKPTSHASLCSHSSLSLLMFSKLFIPYTTSRITDLLISSLENPCYSPSSRSGRCFLRNWTSITGFTEDHAWHMPCVAYNTIIFSIILFCCHLHQQGFWESQPDAVTQSVPHNLWLILSPILCSKIFQVIQASVLLTVAVQFSYDFKPSYSGSTRVNYHFYPTDTECNVAELTARH
jgi:hypothetical protein